MSRTIFWAFPFFILAPAFIQFISFINTDSAWLLVVAERFVAGEQLYIDIAETNPPLIVWLNALVVHFSHLTHLSLHHALIISVLALTCISGAMCTRINRALPVLTVSAFAMVTLFAGDFFAQREHLFILFALPYLLGIITPKHASLATGVFASIGFALKPYFVVFFIIAVLLDIYLRRNWRAALRPIHLGCAVPVCLYAIYLLFIDTTYLTQIVLPLTQTYASFTVSIVDLLQPLSTILLILITPYITWMLFSLIRKQSINIAPIHYVAALMVGAFVTVIMQQKGWGNHWHLFYVFAVCLNALLARYAYQKRNIGGMLFIFCLSTLSYLLLLSFIGTTMLKNMEEDTPAKTLTHALAPYKGDTLIGLTPDLGAVFPPAFHAGLEHIGTYGHLWFLLSFYQDSIDPDTLEALYRSPTEMSAQEKQWFDEVVQEFVRSAPDVVIVSKRTDYYHRTLDEYGFDFISYYSQTTYFAQSWRAYDLIEHIDDIQIYKRR